MLAKAANRWRVKRLGLRGFSSMSAYRKDAYARQIPWIFGYTYFS
jgi:hypothetical protein